MSDPIYLARTEGFEVRVRPIFLVDRSDPEEDEFFWAYQVRIANVGEQTAQLINRHWVITDAQGVTQEVRGEGVVGEQPVIEPGKHFDYTSGVPLTTPSGMMQGSFEMEAEDGRRYEIRIPAFALDSPYAKVH